MSGVRDAAWLEAKSGGDQVLNKGVTEVEPASKTSELQRVIEDVEALPIDDQMLLVEIIRRRLIEHRRSQLVAEVAEAREAYAAGNVKRGTVEELLRDLEG